MQSLNTKHGLGRWRNIVTMILSLLHIIKWHMMVKSVMTICHREGRASLSFQFSMLYSEVAAGRWISPQEKLRSLQFIPLCSLEFDNNHMIYNHLKAWLWIWKHTKANKQTLVSQCLHFLWDSRVLYIHLFKQGTLAERTDGEHFQAGKTPKQILIS